jgi:hypothetical protein
MPGWERSGVIALNAATPRFSHTPSKVAWTAVAMLVFPDRGAPVRRTI